MSIWEIGILTSKNRIALEPDPIEWVNRSIVATRVGIEVIDAEIALESALLLDFHGDPADRIIVTTAKKTGATLITFDKEILAYSKKNEFSALHL